MKRREEELEQEEIESGEINLIPYLDIVTNLMLFLLVSISSGLILGQLNTTLPEKSSQASPSDPDKDPNQKDLQLYVSVTKTRMIVWSLTGLEGTLAEPKSSIERGPDVGKDFPIPGFDYRKLNEALVEIASRRWKGKPRLLPTYAITLQADPDIPYGTIIAAMDAMRCKMPAPDKPAVTCLFPSDEQAIKEAPDPVDNLSGLYDPERVEYDPETHALFHDIRFSTGFN